MGLGRSFTPRVEPQQAHLEEGAPVIQADDNHAIGAAFAYERQPLLHCW
jgi:hypothetical protein